MISVRQVPRDASPMTFIDHMLKPIAIIFYVQRGLVVELSAGWRERWISVVMGRSDSTFEQLSVGHLWAIG